MHKHADDLSLVWYDRGQEILVDAGKFGYLDRTSPDSELGRAGFYYAHPSRVYVESTRAHNTVEVDGLSHPRKGVKPYGSGLLRAGEEAGVLYSGTAVRYETVRHTRVLAYLPGAWLLVHDWLWDNADAPHDYVQRFHFAPELDVAAGRDGFEVALPQDRLRVLSLLPAEAVEPVRGRGEPDLLGWISRRDGELEPCWTTAHRVRGVSSCSMATLMAFGDRDPVRGECTSTPRGDRVGLAWSHGGEEWGLAFGRPDREDFHFRVERSPRPFVRRWVDRLRGRR